MPNSRKLFLLLATAVIGSEIILKFYKMKKAKQLQKQIEAEEEEKRQLKEVEMAKQLIALNIRKPPELWNTVLFFPDPHYGEPNSVTKQLYSYLENAKLCIQMCIYLASDKDFQKIIMKKKREGLVIQVITDYDTMQDHNYTFRCFRFQGKNVKIVSRKIIEYDCE